MDWNKYILYENDCPISNWSNQTQLSLHPHLLMYMLNSLKYVFIEIMYMGPRSKRWNEGVFYLFFFIYLYEILFFFFGAPIIWITARFDRKHNFAGWILFEKNLKMCWISTEWLHLSGSKHKTYSSKHCAQFTLKHYSEQIY